MLAAAAVMPSLAQPPAGPHAAEFQAFYTAFLAASQANDKQKLADLIAFPVQDWSTQTKAAGVQEAPVKDRADFLARYAALFTSSMRSHIPKAKVQAMPSGGYLLLWHDSDLEYSFEFDYAEGTGYRLSSYSIGPY